jgi:hypothetical protein
MSPAASSTVTVVVTFLTVATARFSIVSSPVLPSTYSPTAWATVAVTAGRARGAHGPRSRTFVASGVTRRETAWAAPTSSVLRPPPGPDPIRASVRIVRGPPPFLIQHDFSVGRWLVCAYCGLAGEPEIRFLQFCFARFHAFEQQARVQEGNRPTIASCYGPEILQDLVDLAWRFVFERGLVVAVPVVTLRVLLEPACELNGDLGRQLLGHDRPRFHACKEQGGVEEGNIGEEFLNP